MSNKNKKTSTLSELFTSRQQTDLINMLTYHEGGFHTVAYSDTKEKMTAGIGINLSSVKGLSREQRTGKAEIPRKTLEKLFNKKLETAAKDAIQFIGKKEEFKQLSPVKRSAIVQMAFNMGLPRLKGFKRFRAFTKAGIAFKGRPEEKGFFVKAQNEMIHSKWSRQTGNRAIDLQKSFLTDKLMVDDKDQNYFMLKAHADGKNKLAANNSQEKINSFDSIADGNITLHLQEQP